MSTNNFACVISALALLASCQPQATTPPAAPAEAPVTVTSPAGPPAEISTSNCTTPTDYDLPAGRFDETAQALAHASGCFLKTDLAVTGAVPVKALHGRLTVKQAVLMAIAGTKLQVVDAQIGQLTVTLRK